MLHIQYDDSASKDLQEGKELLTTPGARKAVTLLYVDKSVCERGRTQTWSCNNSDQAERKHSLLVRSYIPEVFLDKGCLARGHSSPAGLAPGIGH